MEKEKNFITDEQREKYTKFLNTRDFMRIAGELGYSHSGVNNILYQKTPVTDENIKVVEAFEALAAQRMSEVMNYIERNLPEK